MPTIDLRPPRLDLTCPRGSTLVIPFTAKDAHGAAYPLEGTLSAVVKRPSGSTVADFDVGGTADVDGIGTLTLTAEATEDLSSRNYTWSLAWETDEGVVRLLAAGSLIVGPASEPGQSATSAVTITVTSTVVTLEVSTTSVALGIDGLAAHVADTDNPHAVTKAQVGLGNADNTSDSAKPVSTQQAAADSAVASAAASDATTKANAAQAAAVQRANHTGTQVGSTITAEEVLVTGTSHTMQADNSGKIIRFTNGSAVTVTLPNNIAAQFYCTVIQDGAGQVGFSAASGATLHNRSSHAKIAGQYGMVVLYVKGNSGGSAAIYNLAGDTST